MKILSSKCGIQDLAKQNNMLDLKENVTFGKPLVYYQSNGQQIIKENIILSNLKKNPKVFNMLYYNIQLVVLLMLSLGPRGTV